MENKLGTNLAEGKSATASSVYSSSYSADKAVDGSTTTRWAMLDGAKLPQNLVVDLGNDFLIDTVRIREWLDPAYPNGIISGFEINTSMNGTDYTKVFTGKSVNTDPIIFPGITARYVQLNIISMLRTASIWEFEVYAQAILEENLALGKSASASSVYSAMYSANKAVDGDTATRWAMKDGVGTPEYLTIDLGKPTAFDYIHINEWVNDVYPDNIITGFEINVSTDGQTWNDVYQGSLIPKTPFGFALVVAQYIQLNISGMLRPASIWEFELYTGDDGSGKLSLGKLIDKAEFLDSTSYTVASWSALQQALSSAEQIYDDSTATEQQIAESVLELYAAIRALLLLNLALNKSASATSVYSSTYSADKAVDGNDTTRWAMADNALAPQSITIDLGISSYFNMIVLKEWANELYPDYIIRGYTIEVSDDQQVWQTIQVGGQVGEREEARFNRVQKRYIRVIITSMLRTASLYEVEVYYDSRLHLLLPQIITVEQLSPVSVPLGTSFTQLQLPHTVLVTLDNGQQISVPVKWVTAAYQDDAILQFIIPGTLQIPSDISNPLGLLAMINVVVTGVEDDYDRLRYKYFESLVGNGNYDVSLDYIRAKLAVIDEDAENAFSTMNTGENIPSLWPDSDYSSDLRTTDFYIYAEFDRLRLMAVAYATLGSVFYQDPQIRDAVLRGMRWLQANKYNTGFSISGGHGFRKEIGTPMILMKLVTLMYNDMSQSELNTYITTFDHYSPDPTHWIGTTSTGANRSNQCQNVVVRGIVGKNSAKIKQGVDALDIVFVDAVNNNTDGFYADGSFVQHAYYAYTGNYGRGLLRDATMVIYLLSTSKWEVNTPNSANIYKWVFKGFNPLIHKANIFDDSQGRMLIIDGLNRIVSDEIVSIIVQLSRVSSDQKPALLQAVKSMVQESDTYVYNVPLPNVIWGQEILDDASIIPRGAMELYIQYARMDFAVQQRPSYAYGISMHSSRMANYELTNNNNLKGWHQGDGWGQLILPDFSQTYNNFLWQTIDSYRLPGTTVNHNTTYPSGRRSDRTWVGGVNVADLYGVTGLDLHPNGQTLEAKKSWFMFDKEIVSLGAGIRSTDEKVVETTIENRMLNEYGQNDVYVDGVLSVPNLGDNLTADAPKSAHIQGNLPGAGCGFVFPEPSVVHLLRESRTGKTTDVNQDTGTEVITGTRHYITMWLEHGTNPIDEKYAYIILPGTSEPDTSAYASSIPVTIHSNTAEVQAVEKAELGILAAVFWQNNTASVAGISCSCQAAVMLLERGGVLEVAVSDPTQSNSGQIVLTLNRSVVGIVDKDTTVSASISEKTVTVIVEVSNSHGSAHKIWFKI